MLGYLKSVNVLFIDVLDVTTPISFYNTPIYSRHRQVLSRSLNFLRVFSIETWMLIGFSLGCISIAFIMAIRFYRAYIPYCLQRHVGVPEIILRTIAGVTEPDTLPWFHPWAQAGRTNMSIGQSLHSHFVLLFQFLLDSVYHH